MTSSTISTRQSAPKTEHDYRAEIEEMRIWIFITRTHERSSRPCDPLPLHTRFNACIQSEEPSECQKTNDQLSGELANASLLVCARAASRKRREEEEEEEGDEDDVVDDDDDDDEEEERQNRFSL
jgi:hypothetical protein